MLGLTSAKSHPHVQLIRAELPSKLSSEPLSESLSKLSSHQIPHSLSSEGTTTATGLYAKFFFVFSSTTPLGASVLCAFSSHSALHFDLGVEQACSAAARVLFACPSRASPSSCSSPSAFLSYEAFPHAEVRRLRIHVFSGSALPSSGSTASSLSSSMRAMYVQGGGRMCFPVRDGWCLPVSHCICHRSCPVVPRSLCLLGRPDVFSRPRLRTTSSPLLHSSILLIPTRSSCASMVWTDTAFGASGCSRTGLCGLVATHFGCPHCVSVSWIIFELTTRGGAGSDSSGI